MRISDWSSDVCSSDLAVQDQLGVDRPDFGILFDDMGYAESDVVPMERLLQPKAEAEVGFVLAEDLVEGELDVEQVRGAVAYAVAATEIVDKIGRAQVRTTVTNAQLHCRFSLENKNQHTH